MLDNNFLRSLGIKDDLLPAAEPNGDAFIEQENTADLPLTEEVMVPPEFWELSYTEIKRILKEEFMRLVME